MTENWNEPDFCRGLRAVDRFFCKFSRFEYALKATGYVKNSASRNAEADWNKFANKIGAEFFDQMKSSKKAKEIFTNPPKKQVVKNDRLDWAKQDKPKNPQQLFEAIRRVRNNLFHGSKVPFDKERDLSLLRASEFVLKEALERCSTMKDAFWHPS